VAFDMGSFDPEYTRLCLAGAAYVCALWIKECPRETWGRPGSQTPATVRPADVRRQAERGHRPRLQRLRSVQGLVVPKLREFALVLPFVSRFNETGTDRIAANIFPFLFIAFCRSKHMIEKIRLP
jgi:hypothetical protein